MDEQALRQRIDEGRSAWPGVVVAEERFAEALARHRPADQELDAWLAHGRSTDLYLSTACAEGDPVALQHLETHFLSRVGTTVYRIDRSPSFADEVRQELRVHLLMARADKPPAIAQYAGRGSLTSWIHSVAARAAVTLKRRSARSAPLDILPMLAHSAPGSDVAYLRELYRDDLQAAFTETLAELSQRQRNILRMHFLDGTPLDRLAVIYGTHRTTLGRWVTQACDQILSSTRKKLAAKGKVSPGTMDSILDLLRSEIDFTASLLLAENDPP